MAIELLQGNCLDALPLLDDLSVDMVLADLPYGTTACKWGNVIPFEPLWEQLHRVCKPNAAMCMFGSEPFSSKMRLSNLKAFRYTWFWQKERAANIFCANKMPLKTIETCDVFYLKQPVYNPQKSINPKGPDKRGKYAREQHKISETRCTIDAAGTRFLKSSPHYGNDKLLQTTLIRFAREHKSIHPTQKPVALLEYLIKTYTKEGDTVLDPTMGSGSTGVACKNLGRNFISIEMDAGYFEIATKRIGVVENSSKL